MLQEDPYDHCGNCSEMRVIILDQALQGAQEWDSCGGKSQHLRPRRFKVMQIALQYYWRAQTSWSEVSESLTAGKADYMWRTVAMKYEHPVSGSAKY